MVFFAHLGKGFTGVCDYRGRGVIRGWFWGYRSLEGKFTLEFYLATSFNPGGNPVIPEKVFQSRQVPVGSVYGREEMLVPIIDQEVGGLENPIRGTGHPEIIQDQQVQSLVMPQDLPFGLGGPRGKTILEFLEHFRH